MAEITDVSAMPVQQQYIEVADDGNSNEGSMQVGNAPVAVVKMKNIATGKTEKTMLTPDKSSLGLLVGRIASAQEFTRECTSYNWFGRLTNEDMEGELFSYGDQKENYADQKTAFEKAWKTAHDAEVTSKTTPQEMGNVRLNQMNELNYQEVKNAYPRFRAQYFGELSQIWLDFMDKRDDNYENTKTAGEKFVALFDTTKDSIPTLFKMAGVAFARIFTMDSIGALDKIGNPALRWIASFFVKIIPGLVISAASLVGAIGASLFTFLLLIAKGLYHLVIEARWKGPAFLNSNGDNLRGIEIVGRFLMFVLRGFVEGLKKAGNWIKNNPKTFFAIAAIALLTTLGVVAGLGYGNIFGEAVKAGLINYGIPAAFIGMLGVGIVAIFKYIANQKKAADQQNTAKQPAPTTDGSAKLNATNTNDDFDVDNDNDGDTEMANVTKTDKATSSDNDDDGSSSEIDEDGDVNKHD